VTAEPAAAPDPDARTHQSSLRPGRNGSKVPSIAADQPPIRTAAPREAAMLRNILHVLYHFASVSEETPRHRVDLH
jgi:hypothetical protein